MVEIICLIKTIYSCITLRITVTLKLLPMAHNKTMTEEYWHLAKTSYKLYFGSYRLLLQMKFKALVLNSESALFFVSSNFVKFLNDKDCSKIINWSGIILFIFLSLYMWPRLRPVVNDKYAGFASFLMCAPLIRDPTLKSRYSILKTSFRLRFNNFLMRCL